MASSVVDCLIIGGGPAGLAAAGALARLTHSSLVFDSGVYRNSESSHIHGFLGWDHREAFDLRAQATADLVARYPMVQFRDVTVKEVTQASPGKFQVVDENGVKYAGRTVILATGVRDVMLDLDGYAECWAKGIFHCLLCHGYEEQGADSVGVLAIEKSAAPHAALHMACSATRLAQHVTIYTNGDESVGATIQGAIGAVLAGKTTNKMSFETRKISRVRMAERAGGIPSEVLVTLEDGTEKQEGFLTHATTCELNGPFPEQLGLNVTSTGEIDTKPPFGESSVPGVYVAGDAMTDVRFVVNAALSGSSAGAGAAFKIQLEDLGEATQQPF
ncbi:unnamed protein product [Discula destructiva]